MSEKALEQVDNIKKTNMLNEALIYLAKGVEVHSKYFQGWLLYGNAYFSLNKYDKAIVCYSNCLLLNTDYKGVLNTIHVISNNSVKNKDFKTALTASEMLIKAEPENPDFIFQHASSLIGIGELDRGISSLNSIIEKDNSYYKAYCKLGETYGSYKQDVQKAKEFLLKAYQINPAYLSTLENLGIVYGIIGNYVKSLEYFDKALQIEPDNQGVLLNISRTYKLMGDEAKTNEYMIKAQQAKKSK